MVTDRLLRMAEVIEITTLSRTTLYRLLGESKFPRPVMLSEHSPRWREKRYPGVDIGKAATVGI